MNLKPDLSDLSDPVFCSAIQGNQPLWNTRGNIISAISPIDGSPVSEFRSVSRQQYDQLVDESTSAFHSWRHVPAPVRGQYVRHIADLVRENKEGLAAYITLEAGKTKQEALGEIQEWIDMCDFATGLSRQLHGLTIASERPQHSMQERWHSLGPVGIISAFNFPVAVWAWNAMLSLICGNSIIWKPHPQTALCALACARILEEAASRCDAEIPSGLNTVIIGEKEPGEWMADDKRLPLISATGSVPMGRNVATKVASRLGRSLLELSGNNAMIVSQHADQDLALRAVLFSAIGTSGQRCTSLRRLIIHDSIADSFIEKLVKAYSSISIGDPSKDDIHMGPLINETACQKMSNTISEAVSGGGKKHIGGERITDSVPESGFYMSPAIIEVSADAGIIQKETFAPVLFIVRYSEISEAIRINNHSDMGLSSAIFTNDIREAERFIAESDCGITNVNIGTSGAEIGGAFGGEKDTGGGRESGSDAWKNYMRRSTNTINYGTDLPLAQGIRF